MKIESCPKCGFVPKILRSSRWLGKWIFYIRIRGFRLMLDKDHSMKRKWFFTENGAGATSETLLGRMQTWNSHYRDLETRDDDDDVIATIHLASDEWLGNILEQSRASAADGRDT